MRRVLTAFIAALTAAPASAATVPFSALPDWTGTWLREGRGVFDYSTAEPPDATGAGNPGEREHPPYTPEWEKKYQHNMELAAKGLFLDPLEHCLPRGVPGIMNQPDGYEFVLRPEQVWIHQESGMQVRRIYTDGRPHASGDALFPTYMGDSIGHWEGQTLVIDTVGLRDDMILDRTGAQLSGKAHIVERIHLVDKDTLEDQFTMTDAEALTRPWVATKRFKRQPKSVVLYDFACAENNRNPVDQNGKPVTLDANGKRLD